MKYEWSGRTASGARVSGTMSASSPEAVAQSLRATGVVPDRVEREKKGGTIDYTVNPDHTLPRSERVPVAGPSRSRAFLLALFFYGIATAIAWFTRLQRFLDGSERDIAVGTFPVAGAVVALAFVLVGTLFLLVAIGVFPGRTKLVQRLQRLAAERRSRLRPR